MKDLETICAVCENDIVIPGREILLASRQKATTGSRVLVGCPRCFRALVLPEGSPVDETALEAWIGSIEDTMCVPMLNEEDIRLPSGMIDNLGKKAYRPGGGGPALQRRPYMFKYGIDPEKAWAAMSPETTVPFKTGD